MVTAYGRDVTTRTECHTALLLHTTTNLYVHTIVSLASLALLNFLQLCPRRDETHKKQYLK